MTDHSNGLPPDEGTPHEDRVPDLHLDRLEALARRAPRDLARAADEAIARRAPALAPSRLRRRFRRRTVALLSLLGLMALVASAWAVLRDESPVRFGPEPEIEGFPRGPGFWSVTRHADVVHVSRHPELFCSGQGTNIPDLPIEIAEFFGSMINMDAPR
ncbi:MAG: hypothetical protein ACKPBA_08930, partial [Planctomycetota bacterium]